MMPVRMGAKAAPKFSTKYSTACAVERTSGTVTSYTVAMTLAEESGMKIAVRHMKRKNWFLASMGEVTASTRKMAPSKTPALEMRMRPLRVNLNRKSPAAPPTK